MQEITSVQNPYIRQLRQLNKRSARRAQGAFFVEGIKMVQEALRYAQVRAVLCDKELWGQWDEVLAQAEGRGIALYAVTEHVIEAISEAKTPQGIVALVEFPGEERPCGANIVALDGVQDPGNVGTIIRTADAAGFGGVILGEGSADVYSAKVLRATMGSVFHLPIQQVADLPETLAALREGGYEIIASRLDGMDFARRRKSARNVLIIGNEAQGISQKASDMATQHLRLPMAGEAESLNAAVAAGIMMYALSGML